MKPMLSAAFIAAAFLNTTSAFAQTPVQTPAPTPAVKRGGVCIGPFHGSASKVDCEHIGVVTISQIYEKGFRVVHMQDNKNTATYVRLVIEER